MRYVTEYLSAIVRMAKSLGALYLLISFLSGAVGSFYFMYLVCFVALAGPIRLAIAERER